MYVKLLSLSGVDVAEQAAWVCRNPRLIETDEERVKARKILIKCLKNGHWSVLEHITASFYITGISRACSHQLVRHRIASYTQTSQRFEHKIWEHGNFVFPAYVAQEPGEMQDTYCKALETAQQAFVELIEMGMPQEDARMILPNAFPTTLVMTANLRSLANFFALRMCAKAQWEIRELAHKMFAKLHDELPDLCDYLGAPCKFNGCIDCQSGDSTSGAIG